VKINPDASLVKVGRHDPHRKLIAVESGCASLCSRLWNRHERDVDQDRVVVGLLTAAFRSACAWKIEWPQRKIRAAILFFQEMHPAPGK
jgi:hypothetical protein